MLARACSHLPIAMVLAQAAHAQQYDGPGGTVPANGSLLWLPLDVTAPASSTLDTVAFGLEQVCLTVEHTWIGDLDIWLVAPDSTAVQLIAAVGYNTDRFTGTCLRDSGTRVTFGVPPYTGVHRPTATWGA